MTLDPHLAFARRMDRADGLAHYRKRFVGAETDLVYFDGNSLGRPPVSAIERVERFLREDWGGRLIRGWDESWMQLPFEIGDRIGRAAIGAKAGQTVIGDSTTVLLYKLARAAFDAQLAARPRPRARSWSTATTSPPTATCSRASPRERGMRLRWIEVDTSSGVTPEHLAEAVGPETALVVLSHVAYRSALPRRCARAHPHRARRRRARSSGTSATPRAPCPSRPTSGASTSPSAAPTSTSTADRAPPRSPTCATTCRAC